jgi:putative ABC transport system permease protein
MIGAIGATDRQVRRVMLANGAAVGTVGAGVGIGVGLGVWFALTPAFENVVGHRYDPLAMPWWAVFAAGLLAVVTSIAASWWPARGVARIPIVSALSGRPAPPQPAHRFALLGTALAAGGFVCLVLAQPQHTAALIITGILATTAGMLLLAPLGIRAVAALATRAPVGVRLALRDLARYQARSGAALAAASLAVGIAATIAVTAATQQAHDRSLSAGNLPNNQLIVWLSDPNAQGGPAVGTSPTSGQAGTPSVPAPRVVAAARGVATAIAHRLGASTVVPLDAADDLTSQIPAGAPPDAAQVSLDHPITENGHHGFSQISVPLVATPAVLTFYGIKAGDITSGADILTSQQGLTNVLLGSGFGRTFNSVTVQQSDRLPVYTSAPNTLITMTGMRSGHFTVEPVGWLIQTSGALTPAQISESRDRAAASGITTEVRTAPDQSQQRLRDYATLTGLLVALGVLAMTVGLIRSETTQDLRTLTAAGAGGRTRRALHATSAGALGLLAGVLGTAGAYLALIAWHWHDVGYLGQPPYVDLAALVLGLPMIAAAGAWLLSRTPSSIARRPLE